MSDESTTKTLLVVLGVCIVCSILVSTAAVSLKPIQEENKKLEKLKNILIAGDLLDETSNIEKTFKEKIEPVIIDMETGIEISEDMYNDVLSKQNFDVKTVAADEQYGEQIPGDEDVAGIRRMPKYMAIYKVTSGDQVVRYIFPVYGKGLWSTMYGFLALDSDLRTVKGFTIYEHGETPGLGGEVDNPKWKAIWDGKLVFDKEWNVKIEVIKGAVDSTNPNSKYQIDGLSGSTLTTRGIDNMVKFWMGENGYGPLIDRLRG